MALAALAVLGAACADSETADTSTTEAQPATPTAVPASTSTTTVPAATSTTTVPERPPPESALGFTTVVSEDGDLVIQVPESVTETLTIDILDPVDWPAPLQGADSTGDVKVYDLGPSGATFSEPVRVSRRLDVAAFDELDLGPVDLPLVTLLTTRDDGTYELLDGLAIIRRGSEIWVTGTTIHFSPVIASSERSAVKLRLAGELLAAPAAIPIGDPIFDEALVNQRLVDIFLPPSKPSAVVGMPVFLYDDTEFVPLTEAELDAAIEAYEERNPATSSPVFDADYNSPYLDELTFMFERRLSDDLVVSLAGYFKKVKPSSLPSTGPLLAWTPEGVDPADNSEAVEIGFGIFLITGRSSTNEPATGTRGIDAQVSISTYHNPFGPYPSNQPIEISLAELEQTSDPFWIFNYKDPPASYDPDDPQSLVDLSVTSVVEAAVEGNRLSAVAGIDCYCDFGYGILQTPSGVSPPTTGTFGDLLDVGAVSVIGGPATGPVTVGVSDTEGEVFSGDATAVSIGR